MDGSLDVEAGAKRMYARMLSQWALDMLQLRRDGLDVPSARGGSDTLVLPSWGGAWRGTKSRWVASNGVESLKWKPAKRAA
jgi:hypothetical protein